MGKMRDNMKILRFRAHRLMRKYIVQISYKTQVELTERTIGTAEAFGLGIDGEKEFQICDSEIEINSGDVVEINGDSGSGKSSILRWFKNVFKDIVADINEINIQTDKPIVDTIGKSLDEALKLLSFVGLNDAFIFLRKYNELSDGQKYRYRVAKLMESGKQTWICDEFCNTLDRDTAKIVAWNMQKFARQLGVTVLVASCNTDLTADLDPNVLIVKRFGKEIKITYNNNQPGGNPCSLIREMKFERGNYTDWKNLSEFHYRSHFAPPPKAIWKLTRGDELCAVIVYSCPPIATFGRKVFFGRVLGIQELNEKVTIISRVVVHPKFRTIGLGRLIVQKSLPLSPTRYTETVAVMAKYNPFFVKAGMKWVCEKTPEKKLIDFMDYLKSIDFNLQYVSSINYVLRFLQEDAEREKEIKQRATKVNHIALHKHFGKDMRHKQYIGRVLSTDSATLAGLIVQMGVMFQTKIYLAYDRGETVLAETVTAEDFTEDSVCCVKNE